MPLRLDGSFVRFLYFVADEAWRAKTRAGSQGMVFILGIVRVGRE